MRSNLKKVNVNDWKIEKVNVNDLLKKESQYFDNSFVKILLRIYLRTLLYKQVHICILLC